MRIAITFCTLYNAPPDVKGKFRRAKIYGSIEFSTPGVDLNLDLKVCILSTGGDLASTWVAKPEVHAEVR